VSETTQYFIKFRKKGNIKGSENANKENDKAKLTLSELNNYKDTDALLVKSRISKKKSKLNNLIPGVYLNS